MTLAPRNAKDAKRKKIPEPSAFSHLGVPGGLGASLFADG